MRPSCAKHLKIPESSKVLDWVSRAAKVILLNSIYLGIDADLHVLRRGSFCFIVFHQSDGTWIYIIVIL